MEELDQEKSNALDGNTEANSPQPSQQETKEIETNSAQDADSLPEELERCFEDKKLVVFFTQWLNSGLNATKAYEKLHPTVKHSSAKVLGSKELIKVNIPIILAAYGVSLETYMDRLTDGLSAIQWNAAAKNYEVDYKTRLDYLKVLGKLLQLDKERTEVNVTYTSTPQQDKLYQTNGNKALFRTPEHLALEILMRVKEEGQATEDDEIQLQELLQKYPEYQEIYREVERRFHKPLETNTDQTTEVSTLPA